MSDKLKDVDGAPEFLKAQTHDHIQSEGTGLNCFYCDGCRVDKGLYMLIEGKWDLFRHCQD